LKQLSSGDKIKKIFKKIKTRHFHISVKEDHRRASYSKFQWATSIVRPQGDEKALTANSRTPR
jgi:hypothetical protein